jgi:hypothetical protein
MSGGLGFGERGAKGWMIKIWEIEYIDRYVYICK